MEKIKFTFKASVITILLLLVIILFVKTCNQKSPKEIQTTIKDTLALQKLNAEIAIKNDSIRNLQNENNSLSSEFAQLKKQKEKIIAKLVKVKPDTILASLPTTELAKQVTSRYEDTTNYSTPKADIVAVSKQIGIKIVETQDSLDVYKSNDELKDSIIANNGRQIENLEKQVSLKSKETNICRSIVKDVNSKLSIKDNQLETANKQVKRKKFWVTFFKITTVVGLTLAATK